MSEGRTCESCGHQNARDAVFCSKCGSKVEGEAPEPAREAPRSERPAREAPRGDRPAKRARRVAGQAKTMIGVGAPSRELIEAAKAAAAEGREEPAPPRDEEARAPEAKRGATSGRTVLGMPTPDGDEVAAAVARAKEARAQREAPAPQREASAAPVEAAPHPERREEQRTPEALGKRPSARPEAALDPTTNRTMLGQPAPRKEDVEAEVARRREAKAQKEPRGLEDSHGSGRMRAPVVYPTDTDEEDALTVLPTRKPPKGLAIAALVLGLSALAIGGGALAWALLSSGPAIRASVVQGESGELLELEVPGAEQGTRVRFGGREEALEAGRARFPLSADALSLGDNRLTVDVIAPDGDVESRTVELRLEIRVRADLGPLASAPPAIEVVVEAPPGSEASIEGAPLTLDANGRGTRRFEIDGRGASAEGLVEHVVRYRVSPPGGEVAQGSLRTRIPLTTLSLDRPGTSVVTDQASVEFAGAVGPGATVTIGGEAVAVSEGRFVHRLAVDEVGEREVEVVAQVSGRAPRVVRVAIRRVADLEAEAAAFPHDATLTYARIAQNPATYRGQRVRFDGLVYNVDVRGGQSNLQILVRECPAGDQCPLWVTYPAATEIERRTRVRVFGTVGGEQQFRSQSGELRVVPRVDATFILPGEGPARR
ncbi:MAG: hypothetical protein KF729_27535 [Sandaracinaceae bacterium]|nr:hypothetical protein [Sandaracinaceae bacterium]